MVNQRRVLLSVRARRGGDDLPDGNKHQDPEEEGEPNDVLFMHAWISFPAPAPNPQSRYARCGRGRS